MSVNDSGSHWFGELLQSLTLGIQRHALAETISQWVEDQALVETTADGAERLIAAWAVLERTQRTNHSGSGNFLPVSKAPEESLSPPPPRVARGIKLILEDVYPDLLYEAAAVCRDKGWYVPPSLLPRLLDRSLKHCGAHQLPIAHHYEISQRYLSIGGLRAPWLARHHPGWARLLVEEHPEKRWESATGPRERAFSLWCWRKTAPDQARIALASYWPKQSPKAQEGLLAGMTMGLSDQDFSWLRQALGPKRKGVRRKVAQLLLLGKEAGATEDFRLLARDLLTTAGNWRNLITSPVARDLLEQYGGADKKYSPGLFWLETVPVARWEELSGHHPGTLLREISDKDLGRITERQIEVSAVTGKTKLLREILQRPSSKVATTAVAILADQLDRSDFLGLTHEQLASAAEALREDRPLQRILVTSRHRWSDRVSRAMIRELTLPLRSRAMSYEQQKRLAEDWRAAASRLDPSIMPWLRSQLDHHAHRPDVFGKLASELLQTTHFRQNVFYGR